MAIKLHEIFAPPHAKRALEVAVAGGHSIQFIGSWGSSARELARYARASLLESRAIAPCPCGCYGSATRECTCSLQQVAHWQRKHFDDRHEYDITIEVPEDDPEEVARALTEEIRSEPEGDMQKRLNEMGRYTSMALDDASRSLFRAAIRQLRLSYRTGLHTLRVARTIANLAGSEHIRAAHLAEAIQYRPRRKA
jgi:magnesium chelatase family protein